MGKETEHKYLVVSDAYRRLAEEKLRIRQGYLSRHPERVVRVRTVNDRGFLTIKGRTETDTREEFEYEVPLAEAERMLALCEGRLIEKTRYVVPFGGHLWEVDEFGGGLAPLVVAEIELAASTRDYPLPPFAGEEVTGDPSYYNSNL